MKHKYGFHMDMVKIKYLLINKNIKESERLVKKNLEIK